MNTRLNVLVLMVLVLALGIVGCSSPATQITPTMPPPTQMPPPTAAPTPNPHSAIVFSMMERFNAGDLDGALAYWDEDAMVYFYGLPPTGAEVYHGLAQVRPVFEENIASHFLWEAELVSEDGDVITTRVKTWHDFTRQIGVAPLEASEIYVFEDGKIVAYVWTLTEESLARLRPALAEIMPAAEAPVASAEDPVSALTITLSSGSCAYNGPLTLQAGELTVTAVVGEQEKASAVTFFTLDAGKDFVDLMVSTVNAGPPSWSKMISIEQLASGESKTYPFTVKEGLVYVVCWSRPPEMPVGALGPFEVKP